MTRTNVINFTCPVCEITEKYEPGDDLVHFCKGTVSNSTPTIGEIEFDTCPSIAVEKAEHQKERKEQYRNWRKDLNKFKRNPKK